MRFSSSSSASVSAALSFHCVGRVMGVTLLLPHTPCRSGLPSGVRGTFQPAGAAPVEAGGDWATSVAATRETRDENRGQVSHAA